MSKDAKRNEKQSSVPNDDEQQDTVELEDQQLDEASGGIGLLLPAVQKVRDTASRSESFNLDEAVQKVEETDFNGGTVGDLKK